MTDEQLAQVLNKLDSLGGQLTSLQAQVDAQHQTQQMLEDLVQDALPAVNGALKVATRELADLDGQFTTEDLIALGKRALANTQRFNRVLDVLEAGTDLLDEAQLLSRPLMAQATTVAAELERKGYLAFAREGWRIADRVVTEFSEDDVHALGDNIVTILRTVKNMTQPDIMALANNAANSLHTTEPSDSEASVWTLMRELGDPKMRKGLARVLRLVKTFADQPDTQPTN